MRGTITMRRTKISLAIRLFFLVLIIVNSICLFTIVLNSRPSADEFLLAAFINGYYVLKFRETDVYKNFIKVCTDLFNSNEVKDWKDSYKNTKDFVYRPDLFNDIFLNFLQDQDIVKKINHLTKQDLFLEDLSIRKVFPSKNSYT